MYIVSTNVQKHVYQEGRPWQPQTHNFCIFCSSHDIRALGILWMYRWIWKCSNLLYRFIFRESLAKVLLKPWRKTAFIWRLGGVNCGLAKASLREVSTAVWAWKCQNWPMKVSKDQNTMQKHRIWMYSHHRKITVAHLSEVLFTVRYSPDVPLKLKMDMAKVWRKNIFYSAKMSFSAWKNLEQPSSINVPVTVE